MDVLSLRANERMTGSMPTPVFWVALSCFFGVNEIHAPTGRWIFSSSLKAGGAPRGAFRLLFCIQKSADPLWRIYAETTMET